MWKGRFSGDTNDAIRRFTQSIDLDWRMVQCDIRGSVAHVRMLVHAGLISRAEADEIEAELKRIAAEAERGEITPKEHLEDVHMNVEAILTERLGSVGAKLHTGRSRNDQSAVTVRLAMRAEILKIWDMLETFLVTLLDKAEEHSSAIVPGYTHLQQAQAVTMGHFWMAHFQAFMRDARRLLDTYEASDECPLGCGALAGSTLPIDRKFTALDLGFSRLCENSMDAVASRDHITAFHYFAGVFGVHVSRMSEDLITYFTSEFGWLKLPDAFCTGSSMMPQKKNPDALELLRGKTGQLAGGLVDSLMLLKGLPLAYNRDLQEDKRSLWRSAGTVRGMLEVMAPLISEVKVDETRAASAFSDGFIFATDAAEYLVARGVPFREAHEMVGKTVLWCVENARSLTSLSAGEWRLFAPQADDELVSLLTPEKSVSRRNTDGGTSPTQVARQIESGRGRLKALADSFTSYREKFPNPLA